MSSREEILARVKRNKPQAEPLPPLSLYPDESVNLREKFTLWLEKIGGKVLPFDPSGWLETLSGIRSAHGDTLCLVPQASHLSNRTLPHADRSDELETLDLAILKGKLGVAENGCIWLDDESMGNRALPFICQHVILLLEEKDLVLNMAQAYERITPERPGYGVFIAGPSKTADIEQSLVIGAHGPRSLRVLFC